MNKSIKNLALSRLKNHKLQTVLIMIAVMLSTVLLTATMSIGIGVTKSQPIIVGENIGDHHARVFDVTENELFILENNIEVEALSLDHSFGVLAKDKLSAKFYYTSPVKGEIATTTIGEGHYPNQKSEIVAHKLFFEAIGAEAKIGNTVTIPIRILGGEIKEFDFVISGFFISADNDNVGSLDRYRFKVLTSQDFYLENSSLDTFDTTIKLNSLEKFDADEAEEYIEQFVENSIGKKNTNVNKAYLSWVLNPNPETLFVVIFVSILLLFFSGIVIYNIYYISHISNIEEFGKLRELGAEKRHIKQLFLYENLFIFLFTVPISLLIGSLVGHFAVNYMTVSVGVTKKISTFSLTTIIIVPLLIFATIYLATMKPIKMAMKVSPIEATRSNESTFNATKKDRKIFKSITLSHVSNANVFQNKKRFIGSLIVMVVASMLIVMFSFVLESMNPYDFARRNLVKGNFQIDLLYSMNDEVYPENNLNMLNITDLLGEKMVEVVSGIDGVTKIEYEKAVMAEADLGENGLGNYDLASINREDMEKLNIRIGAANYDDMVENNQIIFAHDYFIEDYGIILGEDITFTIYDGEKEIPISFQVVASVDSSIRNGLFLIPEDLFNKIVDSNNKTVRLSIHVEDEKYELAKMQLQEIVENEIHLRLLSMDEEMQMAKSSIDMTTFPVNVILIVLTIISIIGYMNTMIANITNRQKDFDTIQALGAENKQIKKMIFKESVTIVIISLIGGIGLGSVLGYMFTKYAIEHHLMGIASYTYPIIQIIILVAALIVLIILMANVLFKKVNKNALAERLKVNY